MNFKDFAKLSSTWKKTNKQIIYNDWPDTLNFDSITKSKLSQIGKFSSQGNKALFEKVTGSTSNEYAFSVLYFIDNFYYSSPVRGNYTSVIPALNFRATPKQEGDNVTFKIELGNDAFQTNKYKTNELKDINYGIAMVAHSHPRVYFEDNSYIHTFFSQADINFLSSLPGYILAIVAGDKLWLACKTNLTVQISYEQLSEVTSLEKSAGVEQMKTYISQNLKNSGIVFYHGSTNSVSKIRY